MSLDPHQDEWPLAPTPNEVRLASGLIGRRLLSVDYEEDGDWEAAYLRFADGDVAVAAVDIAGRSYSAAPPPRRIALVDVSGPLPPMRVELGERGVIDELEFHEQDGAEALLAIRVGGQTIWLKCPGGDYVELCATPPSDAKTWVARRLPL